MRKEVKIGMFGFGCVGQGLYDVLNNSKGFRAEIKRIVVKDKNKKRKLLIWIKFLINIPLTHV